VGLSFLRGLVASVNPCAFVLLPTYLMYFLGLSGARPGDQRASVRRALVVSAAVSTGFMSVFVVVGIVSEYVTTWIEANAKYATLVVGIAFAVLGVAMLAGYRLPISTPKVGTFGMLGTDRATLVAMAGYGVAYAVTSISCTLPLFATTLFGNVHTGGWGSGVANVVAYGLGMALVLTALTIALAVADTTLLRFLKSGMRWVDQVAAVLVLLSGAYLVYYFWVVDVNEESTAITDRVDSVQRRVLTALHDRWQVIAAALAVVVVAAIVYVVRRPRGPTTPVAPTESDVPSQPSPGRSTE
jgi:cytochrome c biogenesis protein CcdA